MEWEIIVIIKKEGKKGSCYATRDGSRTQVRRRRGGKLGGVKEKRKRGDFP